MDLKVFITNQDSTCDECGGKLRPHIVWFGEYLDPEDMSRIEDFALRGSTSGGRFVFLAAGTSGVVYPAAGIVDRVREAGGETWLVNLDPAQNSTRFEHTVTGKSGEVLPKLAKLA